MPDNFEVWKDVQEIQAKAVDDQFDRWKESVDLQIKWQEHLLKLRGESIKQWAALAKANREWAKTHLQRWSITKMKADFKTLDKQLKQTKKIRNRLLKAAANCKFCRRPGRISTPSVIKMWSGYSVLSDHVPFEVIRAIYDRVPTDDELRGKQYRYYGAKGRKRKLAKPASALEWCEKLQDGKYVPRNGTAAHLLLMEVFSHLGSYADKTIDEIAAKQVLLKKKTYDLWKPQEFLKL